MGDIIYGLCALTAFLCAWMLLAAYRRNGYRMLLWGGLCFVGLTLNNIALILDKLIFPNIDFSMVRSTTAFAAVLIMLYGLIWDTEERP